MTSVESIITRELELRFIDARNLATEARMNLGIQGYPHKTQLYDLRREAVRIFKTKPIYERRALQQMRLDLEAVKIPGGSMSNSESSISSEISSRSSIRNGFRRDFMST